MNKGRVMRGDIQGKNKRAFLDKLEKYRGRLLKDFDYKKELEEAKDEKYADFT